MSRSRNIAGVGVCTLVSAGFLQLCGRSQAERSGRCYAVISGEVGEDGKAPGDHEQALQRAGATAEPRGRRIQDGHPATPEPTQGRGKTTLQSTSSSTVRISMGATARG